MSNPNPVPARPKAPAAGRKSTASFQDAIEKAIHGGAAADDLTLRLTLRDAANLRRDPTIPVEAISFAGGEMRLMGVKVITGGVETSALELPQG